MSGGIVVGIGHATLDRVVAADRFPEPDTKQEVRSVLEEGGGPAATAMVAAARMGVATCFLGVVGADREGSDILEGLRGEGVDVAHVQARRGRSSPFSFVVVEPARGRRTILWSRGDAEPLRPGEIPDGLVERASALLVDGHAPEAQAAAAGRARTAGVPVVLDAGSLRDATRDLLPLADHALVSERFARQWCGSGGAEALRALAEAGPGTVVVTQGERGCRGREGAREVVLPALPVEAPDTNGAGDVFHGAYVAALALGWEFERRLRLANAAAGLKCRVAGPRRGIPRLSEARAAAGL